MFKKHLIRLLCLIGIVLISVGFISGIGSPTDMIKDSIENYYTKRNVSDFIVKSKTGGFTDEQIAAVKNRYGENNVETGMSIDIQTGEKRSLRLYFLDLENTSINEPELVEGEKITGDDENCVYAEVKDNVIKGFSVGDKAEIDIASALNLPVGYKINVTIKGIVRSPLTFGKDGEPSYNNPEDTEIPENVTGINELDLLENILYCPAKICDFLPKGDLYIKAENRNLFGSFSSGYEKYVEKEKIELTGLLGEDVRIITLYDNYSFKSVIAGADKVRGIGNILMVIFIAVTLLVVLSSMMRLMDEERSQIACLKTLGYGSVSIVVRYVFFALVALAAGGFIGFFVGYGVSWLICFAFGYSYVMPPIAVVVNPSYYFISLGVIVAVTLIAVFSVGMRLANNSPADLLRPKPPKKGKRILLEKIPFVWKRLSFRYKSSVRRLRLACDYRDSDSRGYFRRASDRRGDKHAYDHKYKRKRKRNSDAYGSRIPRRRNLRLYLSRNIYQRVFGDYRRVSRRNRSCDARFQGDRFRNGRQRKLVYVAARAGRRIRVCAARNADIKTENRKNKNERKSESGRIKNFNESTPDMPGKIVDFRYCFSV